MSDLILTARHAMGRKVSGEALVANDGFSARYDLNRLRGVFSRPTHKLAGQSYIGKILVLDTAKGGVASAWMLNEMQSRDMVPLAIVFNSVNPILVQGAALGSITMLAGFDVDVTAAVPHGALVEIDPQARTLRVIGAARRDADAGSQAGASHAETGTPAESKVRFVNPR
jgi:predicted aconitase with swiveling domain